MVKTIISCNKLTYAWLKPDAPTDPRGRTWEDLDIIFDDFSLDIPPGICSVMGPNGVGKSTLLLLLGGRLQPHEGSVEILGVPGGTFKGAEQDQDLAEQRNKLIGFVYQNMEFETPDSFATILASMASQGRTSDTARSWIERSIEAFGLQATLPKKTQEMAKGELQRAVIVMAMAYGSPIIIMDEPVFALEDDRKHQVFTFLREYSKACGVHIIYSAHDLDLCKQYADHGLLMWRVQGDLYTTLDVPGLVFSQNNVEEAFKTPLGTLYQKERLYRDMLLGGRRT